MAGSPIVVNAMQITIDTTLPLSHYARGPQDFYVFGYVTFGHDSYWETPQWINFQKQVFYPRDPRFDTFKYQGKFGVNITYKPLYGQLDILSPEVQGAILNMCAGGFGGLRPQNPAGVFGPLPSFVPL